MATTVKCPACKEDLTEAFAIYGAKALKLHPCSKRNNNIERNELLREIGTQLKRIADALTTSALG